MNNKPFISVKGKNVPLIEGPPGPDGNPIGTVISYMGTTAPDGYLICDGTVRNISLFPDLADFFKKQFGSANYFGGNGTTTFGVPDLRNMFLRGYHGSTTALSGNIGIKQNPTQIPHYGTWSNGSTYTVAFYPGDTQQPTNPDSTTTYTNRNISEITLLKGATSSNYMSYAARPVNMAVLYCIKAVNSDNTDAYTTDNGWYVRKYADGFFEAFKTITINTDWKALEGFYYEAIPITDFNDFTVVTTLTDVITPRSFTPDNLSDAMIWVPLGESSARFLMGVGNQTPQVKQVILQHTVSGLWKTNASAASMPSATLDEPF